MRENLRGNIKAQGFGNMMEQVICQKYTMVYNVYYTMYSMRCAMSVYNIVYML